MRYVDGTDLRKLLDNERRLAPARTAAIVTQIAGALDEAHRLDLVHRDVKPGNVLIEQRSGREHAYLTDFGITRQADDEPLTRTGVALGSVDYMAPEQAHGAAVDARADIYSLGCMLYEMLTGAVVFDRDGDLEKLWAHVHDRPPRLPTQGFRPGCRTCSTARWPRSPRIASNRPQSSPGRSPKHSTGSGADEVRAAAAPIGRRWRVRSAGPTPP